MIALLYLAILVFFGDALARRWFTFVSLPHRIATSFLVGLLTGTWISYLASLVASGASDPMAVGGLASALGMLVAGIWLWRHPPEVPGTPLARLRSSPGEWFLVLVVGAAVGAMMIWTYHYDQGTLWIAGDLWSDFGPTSAISQSFALGQNFPTEYPHYAGEPIRYHFLYYFAVGNLGFLGLDPATANNLLSILSVVALLVVVAALGERLFGSRLVGWIAVALFFMHGALSFIPYLGSFPSLIDALAALPDLDHFLSSGFPYRGEEWGIWTQDAYLNQRHLPSAIAIVIVILLFVLERLPVPPFGPPEPGPRGVARRLRGSVAEAWQRFVVTLRHPIATARSTLRDPWVPGYILCGLLAGLLPLWNAAMFTAAAVVLGLLFVLLPNRPQMIVLAFAAAIPSLPQLVFLRPGTMAGEQAYPTIYWGYTVVDPTPIRVATYLGFIFGPKLLLSGVALLTGNWRQARVYLAFAALIALAFSIQFSLEVFANHKFIHLWLIVANVFVAYGIVRLWHARGAFRLPGRLVAAGLVSVIVAGGVVDLVPIKNQRMYQVGLDGDPLYEWVKTSTRPGDVFLSDTFVVHGILEAGRRIYLGWPYFAWSAGYDVRGREDAYRAIFAERSPRELVARLQAADIAWVAIDDGLRERGLASGINEEVFQANLELAFDDADGRYGHLAIYRVPTDPAASAELPQATPEDMYAGGPGAAPGQFAGPRGLAYDRAGAVYVADPGNDRIQKFSSSGNLLAVFDGSAAGDAGFTAPTGVAVTSTGSIVVASGARLVTLDDAGTIFGELAATGFEAPDWVDVAVDIDDTIYALDAASGRIAVFRPDGTTTIIDGGGTADGPLVDPTGLAVRNGRIAVADAGNARIVVFDTAGAFVATIPVAEWLGVDVPEADVALDESGTIWASSPATNAVLVYRPDGSFARPLSSPGAELLDRPSGLALRPGGWLFVAGAGGNRVSLLGLIQP
jgi:hypothetical protein